MRIPILDLPKAPHCMDIVFNLVYEGRLIERRGCIEGIGGQGVQAYIEPESGKACRMGSL